MHMPKNVPHNIASQRLLTLLTLIMTATTITYIQDINMPQDIGIYMYINNSFCNITADTLHTKKKHCGHYRICRIH